MPVETLEKPLDIKPSVEESEPTSEHGIHLLDTELQGFLTEIGSSDLSLADKDQIGATSEYQAFIDRGLEVLENTTATPGGINHDELEKIAHHVSELAWKARGPNGYLFGKRTTGETYEDDFRRDLRLVKCLTKFMDPEKSMADLLIKKYPEKFSIGTSSEVDDLFNNQDFNWYVAGLVTKAYKKTGKFEQLNDLDRGLFERTLSAYGFSEGETEDLVASWESVHDQAKRAECVEGHWINIMRLSDEDANLPHEVYETFGIRHFGRYDTEVLRRQVRLFKSQEVPEQPPLLLIAGVWDHNAAFIDEGKRFEKASPIYTEAGNLGELARRLLSVRKKLGPLSGLLINAHGGPNAFRLGVSAEHPRGLTGDSRSMTQEQVSQSTAISHLKDKGIFTPGAEIILFSCSTGTGGGIAETISKLSGMDVVAPDGDSNGVIRINEQGQHEIIYSNRSKDIVAGARYNAGTRSELTALNLND